ncbi:hypothetical protein GVAV_002349 [Gurleya vavrai]
MRKNRKTVTRELYLLIKRMYDVEKLTTKGISERLDLSIKTINRHITNFEAGTVFKPVAELYKETIERKNFILNNEEQLLFNIVARNNVQTQSELAAEISASNNLITSQPTTSRKLKKMLITRKRLSLIPQERNNVLNIECRAVYAAELARISLENILFLDETGLNLHTNRSTGT